MELLSCELVLAEVPRAIRRAAADEPRLPVERLLQRAEEALEPLALIELDAALLASAGANAEPRLRTLDAIHAAAAVAASPLSGFLTYDDRQAAAARLAGLRT